VRLRQDRLRVRGPWRCRRLLRMSSQYGTSRAGQQALLELGIVAGLERPRPSEQREMMPP
jgi:hypothetical protein